MKLLLYGLNPGIEYVEHVTSKDHEIVGYTDSDTKISSYRNKPFYPFQQICSVRFDYIIITLKDFQVITEITEKLINQLGIEWHRILSFYRLYRNLIPWQKVDRVLAGRCGENQYNGMILGISHAAFGINPQYLNGHFLNLALSHQDIYYNVRVFEKCMEQYSNQFHLDYLIFDLYDYTYFNYDVSLSGNALDYYRYGGICGDFHHLYDNKLSKITDKQPVTYEIAVTEQELNVSRMLFGCLYNKENWWWRCDFPNYSMAPDYYGQFIPNIWKLENTLKQCDALPLSMVGGHTSAFKRNEDTIKENTVLLRKLLDKCKEINPNMKIFFVLLPRYYLLERNNEYVFAEWKIEFYNILKSLKKDYQFEVMDFKGCRQFSENNYFYTDPAHFNAVGANAFTSELNLRIAEMQEE